MSGITVGKIYLEIIGGWDAEEQPAVLSGLARAYELGKQSGRAGGIRAARDAVEMVMRGREDNDSFYLGNRRSLDAIDTLTADAPTEPEGGE